jgi:AcrR family transcriptional regulator
MSTTLRKQREVHERERRFLEVARGMLIDHGFAGLSLERLAEVTEYSKGTIYQHFKTKEDLVMALASQSIEQRAALFERVAGFEGRPRERMSGIAIADELFARLYPHSFRSELIIKMANLGDRASAERRETLRSGEDRCTALVRGFIEDAIRVGDLAPSVSIPHLFFAILTMVIGTHTLKSNYDSLVAKTGIVDPFPALRANILILLDGFGWKPLSTEWDYAETDRRIAKEVFADEFRTTGLA